MRALMGMKTGARGNNAECSISNVGDTWRIHLGAGLSDEYAECWTHCLNLTTTPQ